MGENKELTFTVDLVHCLGSAPLDEETDGGNAFGNEVWQLRLLDGGEGL
jgi:hypothetical protein